MHSICREIREVFFVLSDIYKNFIEEAASQFRNVAKLGVPVTEGNAKELKKCLINLGVNFKNSKRDYTENETMYLTFFKDDILDLSTIENRKKLFHELWHFINNAVIDKNNEDEVSPQYAYTDASIVPIEISANYFSRAIILPTREFVDSLMRHIDLDGTFNIRDVAADFQTDYSDVIERCNDLELFKSKI